MPPWGEGPDPQRVYRDDGYEYLRRAFPELDYARRCVVRGEGEEDGADSEEPAEEL